MFDNSGGQIKAMAQLVFWVSTIVFIILAFTVGITTDYYGNTEIGVLFAVFALGGPIVAYIEALFLSAFGIWWRKRQVLNEK